MSVETIDALSRIGIPAAICVTLILSFWRLAPRIIDRWEAAKKEEEKYRAERQKSYNQQAEMMLQMCEVQNNVIAANNEVVRQNTLAMERNIEIHREVVETLEQGILVQRDLKDAFYKHDLRAENMNIDIVKIKESIRK